MTLKQINRAKSRAATITLDKEDEPLIKTFISAKKLIAEKEKKSSNIDKEIKALEEYLLSLKGKKDHLDRDVELISKYLSPSSVEEFKCLENKLYREGVKEFDNSVFGKVVNFFRLITCNSIYSISESWDDQLNRLMDYHNFVYVNSFWARIGDVDVWISNHPYGSFSRDNGKGLPSRITRLRAAEKLLRDTGKKVETT